MIFYFYGKDNFLVKLEADKKAREFILRGFKKTVLQNLADLKNATKTNSLFGEKRCFTIFFDKPKEAEKTEFKKLDFPASTVGRPEDSVFIFAEKSATPLLLFGRKKVEKVKLGEVDEKWLKNQAKEFGIEIDKTLTSYWLQASGERSRTMDAGYFYFELLKLSLYKPGGKTDLADLMKISESSEELNYFEWVRAVLEKNTAKALKHLSENEYESLGRLKSLIGIFELVLVSEGEVSPADKQKFLAKNSPFWVRNIRQWSGKINYQEKLESLEKLLDFEIGVKTGKLGATEALKLFLIN